jgi:hypothetical protein
MVEFHIFADGPIFDSDREQAIIDMYRYTLTERLGNMSVNMIRAYLPTQYMYLGHNGGDPFHNPIPPDAGRLQEAIHTERQTEDRVIVTDTPVTYGAWIEGVSSLNAVTWDGRVRRGLSPRFPGYHAFRIICQKVNDVTEDIAQAELATYVEELNG